MQRERWIDIYRGIGILLVVWGHVYGGYSFELIFLFHMPLFFFISGYLFRAVAAPAAFCRRKAAQLLIPYATFLLLIGMPLALHLWLTGHDSAALRDFAVGLLLGGSRLSAWLAAFWFVTSFYVVLAIEALLIGRCSRKLLLWLHAAMLLLAYANAFFAPALKVPFAANVALAAAPFFYAGYLLRQLPDARRPYRTAAVVALAMMVAVMANHHFGWRLSLGYDMKVTQYGVPGLSFIAALACCLWMMRAARAIDRRWPAAAQVLAELGQAAIVIMFMHMVFTMGLAALLGEQYRLLRVAAGVAGSWAVYRSSLRWTWSRALLLGSAPDQAALRGHRRAMHG
ncbi:acyltransferase family protein [Herbaspirillum sp. LeCh32-8]|uniref:acyltransferase family protein n=1 Tax=Herbaspirillum sp. LeCh32-8 TaxID=2821356 RepID=UPI001AE35AAD|nr:acyltransferase family protein [Herbaspirillum sp. LeCh32-8]MBP0598604.1 acyltransferase family protein [Herbaspirillum sp. LeCh32-8]